MCYTDLYRLIPTYGDLNNFMMTYGDLMVSYSDMVTYSDYADV